MYGIKIGKYPAEVCDRCGETFFDGNGLAKIEKKTNCKGLTTPEPPPHRVTVRATFFNHTKGVVGDKTYSGMSGSPLTIKVDD